MAVLGYAGAMKNLKKISPEEALAQAKAIAAWLEEHKARAVEMIDLTGGNAFTEAIVACTAQSARQARGYADGLAEFCREHAFEFLGMEGYALGEWILLDMNSIVVNIFLPETRELYRLEDLWSRVARLSPGRGPEGADNAPDDAPEVQETAAD